MGYTCNHVVRHGRKSGTTRDRHKVAEIWWRQSGDIIILSFEDQQYSGSSCWQHLRLIVEQTFGSQRHLKAVAL